MRIFNLLTSVTYLIDLCDPFLLEQFLVVSCSSLAVYLVVVLGEQTYLRFRHPQRMRDFSE